MVRNDRLWCVLVCRDMSWYCLWNVTVCDDVVGYAMLLFGI